jgi:type I restriction enzyme R subunit
MILNKKQMTEEDIKLNYITPALQKGWKENITMETRVRFTDGQINLKGNMKSKEQRATVAL